MSSEPPKITALEAIRRRPGMYVQPNDSGSVPDQLLRASLCHPLAELSCGSASHLEVTINGLTATIVDNGLGWPVHEVSDGRRYAETLLSDLYVCRDHKQHAELARSLCQLTLPVAVALSESFTLDVFRGGTHWQIVYRHGNAAGILSAVASSTRSGTTLSFALDPQFCHGAILSSAAFSSWVATLFPAIPQSCIRVRAS